MLDHVLVDGLDQRVVGNGLYKDRAIVVLGRGGNVYLQGEASVLLEHPVVNVLDALEPRQTCVVDVMSLVIEHGQLIDLTHDLAEVGAAVSRLADWLRTEGFEREIAQIIVFQGRFLYVAQEDAVDVGEKQVADLAHGAHVILNVHGELKIILPSLPFVAIFWQDRIVKKYLQPIEVGAQPVQHDDVGGDEQKIAGERRFGLVQLMVETPGDQQRQHLRLSRAGRHLEHVARPVLVEHAY